MHTVYINTMYRQINLYYELAIYNNIDDCQVVHRAVANVNKLQNFNEN